MVNEIFLLNRLKAHVCRTTVVEGGGGVGAADAPVRQESVLFVPNTDLDYFKYIYINIKVVQCARDSVSCIGCYTLP